MRGVYVLFTNPDSDEDKYHDWYDNVHIPAILAESDACIVNATRYEVTDAGAVSANLSGHRFLAIYDIEGDDLHKAMAALVNANKAGRLGTPEGIIAKEPPTMAAVFKEISAFPAPK